MKRTVLTLFALLVLPFGTALGQPNAWINEIHYDNTGGDTGEFIEVVVENAGSFTSALTIELYNGNGSSSYDTETLTLPGSPTATDGNYSVFESAIAGIQNGAPDGVALCSGSTVIQFLSYEGTLTASGGCADGITSTDIGVSESSSTSIGESLQLTGSGSTSADFSWTGPTADSPGAVNASQTLVSRPVTNTDTGESFFTVQAAIDDADTGASDVIEVSAGTYAETVTVNKDVTLNGPNVGTPGAGSRGAEATISGQVILEASGSILDGFLVSPPDATTNPTGEAIRIDSGADGVIVRNNTVQNFTENGLSEDIEGIVAFGGSSDPVEDPQITNNLVQDITRTSSAGGAVGISVQGNVQNATVSGNTVRRISKQTAPYGFGIVVRGSGNTGGPPIDASITNNTISSIISDGTFAGVGFGVEKDPTPGEGDPTVALVTGNTLSNTELQAEDKTFALDLNAFIANNTLDRAAVIRDGGGGVKDETYAQRVYSSIGAPVSRAVAGETVEAFAGTYPENITIDKELTLTGATTGGGGSSAAAKAASCPFGATVLDASGGSIGIDVTSSNVTITDLCVKGAGNSNIYTDATISNLTLTRVDALNADSYGLEVHNDADVTTLNITESTFSGNGSVGMRIRGTVDGLTIDGSAFDKNKFGFYTTLGGTFDATNVSNVTITSTTFNDNSIKGIYAEKLDGATFESIEVINSDTGVGASDQAIDINLKSRDYGPITVSNATISGSIGEGLNVKARNSGSYAPPNDAGLSNLTVENSVFEDNRFGVVVGYGVENASITGNLVNNNGNDVASYQNTSNLDSNRGGVLFYATPGTATFTVNSNCITENGLAERNNSTGYGLFSGNTSVDATNNWWGSAGGPGHDGANSVAGLVTATPFATDPVAGIAGCGAPTNACPAPDFTETVVSNTPPGEVEITIDDTDNGIAQVDFYLIDNLTVSSSGFSDGNNDGVWTPNSGTPTAATFTLTQTDSNTPDASYFAKITNGCGTILDVDPPLEFAVTVPNELNLSGNYPNPFGGQTTIEFALPQQADVTLAVYDVTGRQVNVLRSGMMPAGTHQVQWSGRSANGAALASGVYLVRLKAGDQVRTGRLTIVR